MQRTVRFAVLGAAVAVNVAALAAVHAAMVQTTLREHLAQQEPARIVVRAAAAPGAMAAASCPAPRVL